jgi:hypothetical protein
MAERDGDILLNVGRQAELSILQRCSHKLLNPQLKQLTVDSCTSGVLNR